MQHDYPFSAAKGLYIYHISQFFFFCKIRQLPYHILVYRLYHKWQLFPCFNIPGRKTHGKGLLLCIHSAEATGDADPVCHTVQR